LKRRFLSTMRYACRERLMLVGYDKAFLRAGFFGEYSSEYNLALAAAFVMMLPVLIAFILLQRYFVEGLTRSGLK